MSVQVVICCGSRALADDPAATRWARKILARELASATLVVAGDTREPNAWAREIACAAGTWHERWQLDVPPPRAEDRDGWRRRPLARNAAMVGHLEPRSDVRMVALYSPAATTRGTAHTVGRARAAGIDVTEYVWGMS